MSTPESGLRYKDKVTIVTGGCLGIGLGCVELFGNPFSFYYPHTITRNTVFLKVNTGLLVPLLTLKAPPTICSRRQFQILLFFFSKNTNKRCHLLGKGWPFCSRW